MKKILIIVAVFASVGLVAFKLMDNKHTMAENAKLAEETSTSIPVQIDKVSTMTMDENIVSTGTFEAISDLTMLSQTSGLVVKVYHEKGDFVKKGELLAQVENEILQADLMAKEADYEKSKTDLARFEKLNETKTVTDRQVEDIRVQTARAEAQYKTAKKKLDDSYIRATANGFINEDYIQEGSNIADKGKLYDLVDVSKLYLNVKLTAKAMLNLKVGDAIDVTTEIYPGVSFNGKVNNIAAKADEGLKYNVEILIDNNKETPLRAGMFGKANFHFSNLADGLYIHRDALVGSVKNPEVFVVENGKSILKTITIGEVNADHIEVLDGLKQGDAVVVNGQINLKDGTTVHVIN